MSTDTARKIAGYWHSGQFSPLYAFTSTGSFVPGLSTEIAECLAEIKAHPTHYTYQDRIELTILAKFVAEHETTETS